MKKTNIRINDHFLIKKNDQYFLSDITDQDQWINTENLVNHKGKNVTSKLQELTDQYNISYNVNFITGQTGGWPNMASRNKAVGQTGGGWNGKGISTISKLFEQTGGWGPKKN